MFTLSLGTFSVTWTAQRIIVSCRHSRTHSPVKFILCHCQ